MTTRVERDSMGEVEVSEEVLWGAQTQRAVDNFAISGSTMPRRFVVALLLTKACAAQANRALGRLPENVANAIMISAEQLLEDPAVMRHFPVDVFQTGSGTSTNMNANEVLAYLASQKLGKRVSANDQVNMGQSSNDVIPSCIHISAAMALADDLIPALEHLSEQIGLRSKECATVVKTGRTHLMDAVPVTLGQSLGAWATQVDQVIRNLNTCRPMLQSLAQGGTAVGTGLNSHPEFSVTFCDKLSDRTGLTFTPAENFMAHIATQDVVVSLSGQLKTLAVALIKISNDLRWMNAGPMTGFGEIELAPLQPGSSIMPGKVNPVIPEAVLQAATQVIGNDAAITAAAASGNFELNVMLPLIARNLLENIKLLSNSSRALADKAIATFRVNHDRINDTLSRNPILATALNPVIGYMEASEIARIAYVQKRSIIDVAEENTSLSREELEILLDPTRLTRAHRD